MNLLLKNACLSVDFESAEVSSFVLGGKERISGRCPLFRLRLRNRAGEPMVLSAYDAKSVTVTESGARYESFSPATDGGPWGLSVSVSLCEKHGDAEWRISVSPENEDIFVEWVDFPLISLPRLASKCEDGGSVLLPYNEGALISDWELRQTSPSAYKEPEYPSEGSYMMFPNMVFAQMEAYLWRDAGLYIGVHDDRRGVKAIDFYEGDEGTQMQIRLFCGVDFGETFETDYPIVWSAVGSRWESAAERYREYFESSLPRGARKILENEALPEWYSDEPLVVGYPVRGIYDRDDMTPNRMYPYTNALPKLQRIKDATKSRLLVLLMHWEGSAPWAPPYVLPPFGDAESFWRLRETLKEQGDMMGVYCSGFSYTIQSCMIPEYNKQEEFDRRGLINGMCASPDGSVSLSKICTMQRSGYDVCPASELGREIVNEAYLPLLESGLDYAQILDQNHGGSQYFCYSRNHGHPPAPGTWMTERMQELLGKWNEKAGKMLLGCESAAAEPYVGNLLFSDNRYELNYKMGVPVPLYNYIYHEYLRNFMGNQVSCPLREQDDDNLLYRLAYSFSIGDCMTLIINQDGQIKSRWGKPKTDHIPDQERVLRLVKNLTAFYHAKAKPYLFAGRMIAPEAVECPKVVFLRHDIEGKVELPVILTTAWQSPDGGRGQILVNPFEAPVECTVGGRQSTVDGMNCILIEQ